MSTVKLTQYSHGYGCGCKIAPAVLDEILKGNEATAEYPALLVGNDTRDDAAVFDLGNGTALISTTDFFMPIVDDAYDFGRIAATNAISDIYAMGGKPVMAIAILGWPVDKLAPEIASRVIAGGRSVCEAAGIPLAGGHSIDSPEPIFGLAVNGLVDTNRVLRNDGAKDGDLLFLTKPIGVGIITTAIKKGVAVDGDLEKAIDAMTTLNKIGSEIGKINGVNAVTDVTGFGLFGHLLEMLQADTLMAELEFAAVPLVTNLRSYLDTYTIPAITYRNWNSYGHLIRETSADALHICCDPQTSGGLLIAIAPESVSELLHLMQAFKVSGNCLQPIGKIKLRTGEKQIEVHETISA